MPSSGEFFLLSPALGGEFKLTLIADTVFADDLDELAGATLEDPSLICLALESHIRAFAATLSYEVSALRYIGHSIEHSRQWKELPLSAVEGPPMREKYPQSMVVGKGKMRAIIFLLPTAFA